MRNRSIVYYRRLVAAFRSAGRPLELTIAHADIDVLARNAAADDRTAQARVYAGHLAQLKAAGADVGTITSLGGHFCFADTKAISPLPLIDAIAPLEPAFAAAGITAIGLLGTRQVLRSALYGQLHQTRAVLPRDVDAVHETYIAIALAGHCTADQRAFLFAEGQSLMDAGADAVLLGGTDLGLAFDGFEPGYPIVDAIDVHVAHLLALAAG